MFAVSEALEEDISQEEALTILPLLDQV